MLFFLCFLGDALASDGIDLDQLVNSNNKGTRDNLLSFVNQSTVHHGTVQSEVYTQSEEDIGIDTLSTIPSRPILCDVKTIDSVNSKQTVIINGDISADSDSDSDVETPGVLIVDDDISDVEKQTSDRVELRYLTEQGSVLPTDDMVNIQVMKWKGCFIMG